MPDAPIPPAVPTISAHWAPSPLEQAQALELARLRQWQANDDAARAAAPRVVMIAITEFTIVDDESPNGRTVRMGEEFEISQHDYRKFEGKGLPKAGLPGGTITQPSYGREM